jgi:hypothetical protein
VNKILLAMVLGLLPATALAGVLRGIAVDTEGRPIHNLEIAIVDGNHSNWDQAKDKSPRYIKTTFDGSFEADLGDATYTVFAMGKKIVSKVVKNGSTKDPIELRFDYRVDVSLKADVAASMPDKTRKVINQSAAQYISAEAAKYLSPDAAKVLHPARARMLTPEEAKTLKPNEARKPPKVNL